MPIFGISFLCYIMQQPPQMVQKRQVSLSTTIILILVAVFLTAQFTWAVGFIHRRGSQGDLSRRANEIRQLIDRHFPGEIDQETREYLERHLLGLEQYALNSIFSILGDRYAEYMTAEQFNAMMEQRTGNFVGIGVSINSADGAIVITDVNEDGPAMAAGLQRGDIIYAVNGVAVSQTGVAVALDNIRGAIGTTVEITIVRDGEEMLFPIVREQITTRPIVYAMAPDGETGIVRIQTFANDHVSNRFREALYSLQSQGATRFLFDLRYNGGGSLDMLVEIMQKLLPEGPITTVRFGDGTEEVRNNYADANFDFPIVVLVNQHSASASELFAAALRDYDMAVIVGQTTYGKGSLQRFFRLSNGSVIRLTAGMYYPPSGVGYDGIGVIPDVFIECGQEVLRLGRIEVETDTKLYTALQQFAD
ncbi:MAG: S41 family peptidase [Oscillospiraceae bacterium]|nr:S41 family peptidase [Oscillospiraceae bacterium]